MTDDRAHVIELEVAYEAGRTARAKSAAYKNPYPFLSPEERKFYEGWCWQNYIEWNRDKR